MLLKGSGFQTTKQGKNLEGMAKGVGLCLGFSQKVLLLFLFYKLRVHLRCHLGKRVHC